MASPSVEKFRLCRDRGGCLGFIPGPLRLDCLSGDRETLCFQGKRIGREGECELVTRSGKLAVAFVVSRELGFEGGKPAVKAVMDIFPSLQDRSNRLGHVVATSSREGHSLSVTVGETLYTTKISRWKGLMEIVDSAEKQVCQLKGRGGVVEIEANTQALSMEMIACISFFMIV